MEDHSSVWTADETRSRYGKFYAQSSRMQLDPNRVPRHLWPLLPYAEFWRIPDEPARLHLVREAPLAVLRNFDAVVEAYENALQEWMLALTRGYCPPNSEARC